MMHIVQANAQTQDNASYGTKDNSDRQEYRDSERETDVGGLDDADTRAVSRDKSNVGERAAYHGQTLLRQTQSSLLKTSRSSAMQEIACEYV